MVYEYIGCTRNKALVDYFVKMITIYPSRTKKKSKVSLQKRDHFQTPSACVYIHTDQHQGIISVHWFVLSEGGC